MPFRAKPAMSKAMMIKPRSQPFPIVMVRSPRGDSDSSGCVDNRRGRAHFAGTSLRCEEAGIMGYRIAVVGATGNVGREILNILAERQFPLDEVAAVASPRSTGD